MTLSIPTDFPLYRVHRNKSCHCIGQLLSILLLPTFDRLASQDNASQVMQRKIDQVNSTEQSTDQQSS